MVGDHGVLAARRRNVLRARNRIKYEIFYYVHHFVFIMLPKQLRSHILDDNATRRGQERSGNFKWFSASLVWSL